MKTQATAKYVGTSTRKLGLVAQLIRGKSVSSAQLILTHANKRATDPVGKVLSSALANAQNNHNAKKADLTIESVLIGPAPTLKRFRPRAKGSASSIHKRSSHITVVLTDIKPTPKISPTPSVDKANATKNSETPKAVTSGANSKAKTAIQPKTEKK